jgi:F-type H+-transporting ATPase subunit b
MAVSVTDSLMRSLWAVGSSESPVDFDASLFIMLGLFLGLMFFLNKVLFKPYLDVKEQRYERIQGAKLAARQLQDRAQGVFTTYEEKLGTVLQEGGSERAAIKAEAKRQERDILSAARAHVEEDLAQSRRSILGQLETARADLGRRAQMLATTIVMKLLG